MAKTIRSPFPGMDPYMEASWGDVHSMLAAYARDALNGTLPPGLVARTESRVYVEKGDGLPAVRRPDISVTERWSPEPATEFESGGTAAATLVEPVRVHVHRDPVREPYIEIRDGNDLVITVVEFISPSNKTDSRGFIEYRRKRDEIYDSTTNLVEIDLTRAGGVEARFRLWSPISTAAMDATYGVCVFRTREQMADVYPIPLHARLPRIKVPLRPEDADVELDLQPFIERVWQNGRYETTDYSRPLQPPLEGEETQWAAKQIEAWQKARHE